MEKELANLVELAQSGALPEAVGQLQMLVTRENPVDSLTMAAAYELLGRCQYGLLANVQAQEAFAEAAQFYSERGETESAAYCELMRVRQLLDERLLPAARQLLTDAWKRAKAHGWRDVLALIAEFESVACMHAKEHAAAIRQATEALSQPDSRKLDWELLVLQMTRASCFLALGDVVRGREELHLVIADPRVARIPRLGKFALMNQGYGEWLAQDFSSARAIFAQVLEDCQLDPAASRATQWLAIMAQYNMGLVDIQLEDYHLAHERMLAVWQLTREHGHSQLACASLNSLCITSLMQSDAAGAVRYAKLCLDLAQQHDDIEAHLAPYYLAVAYLADGQAELAIATWNVKPAMESNAETQLQFRWIARLLRKIAHSSPSIPPSTRELIRQWCRCLDERLPCEAD